MTIRYSTLATAATGLALALSPVATPALANDDATVGVTASTSVHTDGGKPGLGNFLRAKLTGHDDANERDDDRVRVGSTTRKAEKEQEHVGKVQDKAGFSIDARIKSLQDLSTRIGDMKLLSSEQKTTLQASITAEINILTDLKTKIGSDTATSTLKTDVQSITKANRVYLLVIPQGQIAATAGRIKAVATQMEALSVKLSARITAAQTAGADVAGAEAALTDFNAKVADAKVQADAAVTETKDLKPDNGDATLKASNTAALKDARTKLQAAEADLKAARKDAQTIYVAVKGKGTVQTTATTTP